MSFLLTKSFFKLSEINGKLLAGRLFIKVTELPMFPLTLLPLFHCKESNSENVTFQICELQAALFDRETEEDRVRGVMNLVIECFVVIVDEKYEEEYEKRITFL